MDPTRPLLESQAFPRAREPLLLPLWLLREMLGETGPDRTAESCWLLRGGSDILGVRVDGAVRLPNRDPRPGRFEIAPEDFAAAEWKIRCAGSRWIGFAHSHPDGSARPSEADVRAFWTGCVQLVIGIGPGPRARVGAYRSENAGLEQFEILWSDP
ncbi:MAG: M67 family metallopeptidase [Planctomycetota bacterium]